VAIVGAPAASDRVMRILAEHMSLTRIDAAAKQADYGELFAIKLCDSSRLLLE
jgi:hypothetical protein